MKISWILHFFYKNGICASCGYSALNSASMIFAFRMSGALLTDAFLSICSIRNASVLFCFVILSKTNFACVCDGWSSNAFSNSRQKACQFALIFSGRYEYRCCARPFKGNVYRIHGS